MLKYISPYSANYDIPMGTTVYIDDIDRFGIFIFSKPYTDFFMNEKNDKPFLIGTDDDKDRSIGWYSSCSIVEKEITPEEIKYKIQNYCDGFVDCNGCDYRGDKGHCKERILLRYFNMTRRV